MVMEYLRGKSLAKLVEERGGALGEQEAVGYILKVCEALDVVHKAGYLHRDIKPENIIVCGDGRVVLVDFGAARAYMAGKTGRMTVILTPGFAPLEQYAEQAKRGAYTDIYALGATLYYLLTGQVPVSAADRFSGVELKSVREINGRVSRQVEEAVMKAMAMRVEERPQSVEEFVRLLTSPSVGVATSSVGVSAAPKVSVPSVVKGVWREVTTLRGHEEGVISISFSPDSRFLASGSGTRVKVWKVESWQETVTLWYGYVVYFVSFSPGGRFLATGGCFGTMGQRVWAIVRIWEVGSWREIAHLLWHKDRVHSFSFSPNNEFLALGGDDEIVRVWELARWKEIATLGRHEGWVYSISFSPNGKFLASGSSDGTVKVWEVGKWREVATLRGHENTAVSVSFSADGKFIASGSLDETVRVWQVGSWREVATLKGHGERVRSVAFSPDNKFLASGGHDHTVKIWEVGSWQEVATLRGHGGYVYSVAFSPDGKFLASGSEDKTVKVWEVGG
jgi:hypothetical protein